MPLNAPNLLTLLRIGLVPVMILLLVADDAGPMHLAAAVFGAAALTDVAEGLLELLRESVKHAG